MGTIIVGLILLVIVALVIFSICRKFIRAKKTGSCCCGCSGGCSNCHPVQKK